MSSSPLTTSPSARPYHDSVPYTDTYGIFLKEDCLGASLRAVEGTVAATLIACLIGCFGDYIVSAVQAVIVITGLGLGVHFLMNHDQLDPFIACKKSFYTAASFFMKNYLNSQRNLPDAK